MDSRKVVVAGGTGLIGRAVTEGLATNGWDVVVLTRSSKKVEGAKTVAWDGRTLGDWAAELDGAHGVVNMAGTPVIKRWTPSNRRAMLDSRLELLELFVALHLVHHQRITLAVGVQTDPLPEVIHRRQVLHPVGVDRLQHEPPLDLTEHLGCNVLFNPVVEPAGMFEEPLLDTLHPL